MSAYFRIFLCLTLALCGLQSIGCASAPPEAAPQRILSTPDSDLVEISVLATSEAVVEIPPGSRIVISDIAGPCSFELKNALTKRLVDNAKYEVLSRDNLELIMLEADQTWAGRFNSETAVKLGELLGASMFIVGQVIYCGSEGQEHYWLSRTTAGSDQRYDVFAVLQVIDPHTGKVLLSSANEGKYLPESSPLLFSADLEDYGLQAQIPEEVGVSNGDGKAKKSSRVLNMLKNAALSNVASRLRSRVPGSDDLTSIALDTAAKSLDQFGGSAVPNFSVGEPMIDARGDERSEGGAPQKVDYPIFRASEDLANGFADKLYGRPHWERVEMWSSTFWKYGESVRYVKLGNCPVAIDFLEQEARSELSRMPDKDVAEYLHNYGVALLCANRPEEAMEKLRSAYRINYAQSTLKMLGLAAKVTEWSLTIEIDRQPEVGMLVDREGTIAKK